jgi:hypothetical protein
MMGAFNVVAQDTVMNFALHMKIGGKLSKNAVKFILRYAIR